MTDTLEELLKTIHAADPRMIEKLSEIASGKIKEDKLFLYGMLFGKNKGIDYDKLLETLKNHPQRRIDFSFTAIEKRFKVSVSYNELPKLEDEAVLEGDKTGDNNGEGNTSGNKDTTNG